MATATLPRWDAVWAQAVGQHVDTSSMGRPALPLDSRLQPAGRMRYTRPKQLAVHCKAQVSDAEGNFLSFSAFFVPASSADGVARGAVTAHFGRPSRAGGFLTKADCGRVVWPHLQAIRILAMHQQVAC
jgi:hypothetical protein